MKIRITHIIMGILILITPLSHAADNIDISGYSTFKVIGVDNDDKVSYYNLLAKESHANFDTRETNIGLQFATDISSKMDMTVILAARGGSSKYDIEVEWAYSSYKFNDNLYLRIGKVKAPFYMVSEYQDVGYAYPWVTPPEEVYSTNPIRSVNGLDFIYQTSVNDVTYLFEIYYGSGTNTAFAPPKAVKNGTVLPAGTKVGGKLDFETHGMLGINASIAYEGISFRLGYFKTKVDFGPDTDLDGEFGGIGMTIDISNFVLYSEYIIRNTQDSLKAVFPDQKAYYLTAGYRVGDYLPYVTVANLDEGNDSSPFALKQDSTAIGLRIEIDDAADLKFEVAQKDIDKNGYGLFDDAVTNGGNVYTIAVDVLF